MRILKSRKTSNTRQGGGYLEREGVPRSWGRVEGRGLYRAVSPWSGKATQEGSGPC